jgi:hypothetical protein
VRAALTDQFILSCRLHEMELPAHHTIRTSIFFRCHFMSAKRARIGRVSHGKYKIFRILRMSLSYVVTWCGGPSQAPRVHAARFSLAATCSRIRNAWSASLRAPRSSLGEPVMISSARSIIAWRASKIRFDILSLSSSSIAAS